ncbi:hypothetical protein HZA97_08440 [Candidatus Woesearchaeota archaeon]|nr:hypothetical protein [Candidatus Woesearchaeota archaeon]
MTIKQKSVCFVCWHGVCHSLIYRGKFEDYLKSINVSTVRVSNTGLSHKGYEGFYDFNSMRNSDLVILTLDVLSAQVVEDFNPRGKVYNLREICMEAHSKGYSKWEPIVYQYLMQT